MYFVVTVFNVDHNSMVGTGGTMDVIVASEDQNAIKIVVV